MIKREELSLDKQKILDNIGLIALDLDRTTLSSKGLTETTRLCLEEAMDRGYQVVIATGRPFVALPKSIYNIRGLKYVICSNGAHIIDIRTGEFIYSDYLSCEASKWCKDFLLRAGYPIEVFSEGAAYVARKRYEFFLSGAETVESAEYVLNTRKPVEDIWTFWEEHLDTIENINVLFEDQESKRSLLRELSDNQDIGFTVTSSMFYNLEIGGR
ncbi:MAG: HAD hydrolase family protein, partial [Clostridiales bacterium]|nr:HAD hydrolase family protein [Clostridiales bacterium]